MRLKKVNGIAIASIDKINGMTDANIQALNGLEFTGFSLTLDDHVLISTPLDITTSDTAVSAVTVTSGIDSTYDVYEFHFINIHPSTTASILSFQVDTGTNTNYNQPITSTSWEVEHDESGSTGGPQYRSNRDLADDGTGTSNYQQIGEYIGNTGDDDDLSGSGILTLFAPADGTYVKHWMSTFSAVGNNVEQTSYHAGYINTATAITRIKFVMTPNVPSSVQGDIESGTIKMYGLAKS